MKKTMNAALLALVALALIAGITVSSTEAAGRPGTPGGKPVLCMKTCDVEEGLWWICCPIYERVDKQWVFSGEFDCYWGEPCI
jgi:hypothetical protein